MRDVDDLVATLQHPAPVSRGVPGHDMRGFHMPMECFGVHPQFLDAQDTRVKHIDTGPIPDTAWLVLARLQQAAHMGQQVHHAVGMESQEADHGDLRACAHGLLSRIDLLMFNA